MNSRPCGLFISHPGQALRTFALCFAGWSGRARFAAARACVSNAGTLDHRIPENVSGLKVYGQWQSHGQWTSSIVVSGRRANTKQNLTLLVYCLRHHVLWWVQSGPCKIFVILVYTRERCSHNLLYCWLISNLVTQLFIFQRFPVLCSLTNIHWCWSTHVLSSWGSVLLRCYVNAWHVLKNFP